MLPIIRIDYNAFIGPDEYILGIRTGDVVDAEGKALHLLPGDRVLVFDWDGDRQGNVGYLMFAGEIRDIDHRARDGTVWRTGVKLDNSSRRFLLGWQFEALREDRLRFEDIPLDL